MKKLTKAELNKACKKINLGLANYIASKRTHFDTFPEMVNYMIAEQHCFDVEEFKRSGRLHSHDREGVSLDIWLAEAMSVIRPEMVDSNCLAQYKAEAVKLGYLIASN